MSVYMNYPPTWRPLDFAMHYGIGVNTLNYLVISHLGEWENAEPIKPYGQ